MSSFIEDIHTHFLIIDTAQMLKIDRLMILEYHIDLIQMMENTGSCLAQLTKERFFQGDIGLPMQLNKEKSLSLKLTNIFKNADIVRIF